MRALYFQNQYNVINKVKFEDVDQCSIAIIHVYIKHYFSMIVQLFHTLRNDYNPSHKLCSS